MNFAKAILFLSLIFPTALSAADLSFHSIHTSYMNSAETEERQKVAKAILELHDLYISTGEEKKPMTISLPDLAVMAGLSKESTERVLIQLVEEKIIRIEKSAITILEKKKLKKIAG